MGGGGYIEGSCVAPALQRELAPPAVQGEHHAPGLPRLPRLLGFAARLLGLAARLLATPGFLLQHVRTSCMLTARYVHACVHLVLAVARGAYRCSLTSLRTLPVPAMQEADAPASSAGAKKEK